MKTDSLFCQGEVKVLMEKRRKHEECSAGGCEVVVGRRCEASQGRIARIGRMGRVRTGRFECMGILIDPRLVYLAVLIAVFSVMVSVFVGVRLSQKWIGA